MDYVSYGNRLKELQTSGYLLIEDAKQCEHFDAEMLAQISSLFQQFISQVETAAVDAQAHELALSLRQPLERFLQITLSNHGHEDPLCQDKTAIRTRLGQPSAGMAEFAPPYALFVKIVQQPDMNLSEQEDLLIHNTFAPHIIRLLYQGKFTLPDHSACEIPVETYTPAVVQPVPASVEKQEDLEPEKTPEPVAPCRFSVHTDQERTALRIKEFTSTYFSHTTRKGGALEVNVARSGDLMLMHLFSKLGALTLPQLQRYVFSPDTPDTGFHRLCKRGYLSHIVDEETKEEFYALSTKGTEVFKSEKSARMMKRLEPVYKLIWNAARILPYLQPRQEIYLRNLSAALYLRQVAREEYGLEVALIRAETTLPNINICMLAQDQERSFLISVRDNYEETSSKVRIVVQDTATADLQSLLSSPSSESAESEDWRCYCCEVCDGQAQPVFTTPDGQQIAKDIIFGAPLSSTEHMAVDELPFEGGAASVDFPQDVALLEPDSRQYSPPIERESSETIQVEDTGEQEAQAGAPTAAELSACENPIRMAERLLQAGVTPENRALFVPLIDRLMSRVTELDGADPTDYLGRALVLLKALSLAEPDQYAEDCQRLLLATDLPLGDHHYTTEALRTAFYGEHAGTGAHLSALLRALFCPGQVYDHELVPYANGLLEQFDTLFHRFAPFKQLFNNLLLVPTQLSGGFTEAVIGRTLDAANLREITQRLQKAAEKFQALPNIHQRINGLPEMLDECFGPNSPMGRALSAILSGEIQAYEVVKDVLQAFSEGGEVSEEKILSAIQEAWNRIRQTVNRTSAKLAKYPQEKILASYQERLALLKSWLDNHNRAAQGDVVHIEALLSRTRQALAQGMAALDTIPRSVDRSVLEHMLPLLAARLDGDSDTSFHGPYWLCSGLFPVSGGWPVMDDKLAGVPYYEPWRNVLRHLAQSPKKLPDVLEQIDDPSDPLYDNLGQAIEICVYLKNQDKAELYRSGIPNAQAHAKKVVSEFHSALNIDYAYNRIDEQAKETALSQLEQWKPYFWETSNFAQLNHFLAALRRTLDEEVARNREGWQLAIKARRNRGGLEAYLDRAEQLLQRETANFIQIEDLLSSFDTNTALSMETPVFDSENMLERFIERSYYDKLLSVCHREKGKAFRDFAPAFVKAQVEQVGRSRQYTRSAEALVSSLPNKPQDDGAGGMKILLEELGFGVARVTRENRTSSPACFRAEMIPDKMNRSYYPHPIAEMGTRIPKEIYLIELFGSVEPESILSNVRRFDPHHMPIVFLNGSLTLGQRRQLAALFHQDGKAASPFILVDWVLLLHLATKVKEDRLKTLLACTLPYTGTQQLFSMTSSIPIADEMYIGRNDEMSKILDMNGPVIVYGGRQLGKTALLQRAKNRFHMPAEQHYSIFVDVKDCSDEASFVGLVNRELGEAGIELSEASTISALCNLLRTWFKQGNRKLLMLVDEADTLLSTLSKVDYAPLTPLETLCRAANGSFKFVFAGLHNVFLAAKAKGGNPIFGHFGSPLCIRPMSHVDAYKLLAHPLSYMGFSVDADMLLRVLINTNFYPGVVHLIGSKLIDMLTNQYAVHYSDKENPPYQLTERQIGAIMNSTELNESIAERIRMTLKVDPSYMAIAQCIALLYSFEEDKRAIGYTVAEILSFAREVACKNLKGLDSEACAHLLSELCDMSILVEREGCYRFRQARFLNIIGKDSDKLLDDLSAEGVDGNE